MKKVFLLLLLTSFMGFSQEDKENREVFKIYKKFPIESVEIKEMVVKSLNDIVLKTKDTVLISEIKRYNSSIDTISLPDFKKVDFDAIPKDKLKNFTVDYDKFKKSGFVKHKKYKDKFSIYLNLNKENSHIRIKSRYLGSSWLFVEKIIFLIDNKKYELDFKSPDRDVLRGSGVNVKETTDQAVLKESLSLLNAICNSKSDIDMRFQGSKGVRDVVLSLKEIQVIKETLELYNSL